MIAMLAGCSATEVVDDLVEDAAGIAEKSAPEVSSPADARVADPSIAKPEFESIISGSKNLSLGSTIELNGSAKSPDGGTVTYQWYRNNVDSNGGGMPVSGATEARLTVKADEVGSTFYYVVAANNHDNRCNMITSSTYEVVTYKNGDWKEDEFGKKYISEDGSYPAELWLLIEGETYHFDSAGYITKGWLASGKNYYYFDEDGKLAANAETPDGYKTDENGRLIGNAVPQLYPTTAEIAAQAKAAADAEGEAAAMAAEKEKADAAHQTGSETSEPQAPPAEPEQTQAAEPEPQPAEEQAVSEEVPAEGQGDGGYSEEPSDDGNYGDGSEAYDENSGE